MKIEIKETKNKKKKNKKRIKFDALPILRKVIENL